MRKLLLLVEGQTEETFVRDVLSPWLASRDINPIAIIVRTKLVAGSPSLQGGPYFLRQDQATGLKPPRRYQRLCRYDHARLLRLAQGFPQVTNRARRGLLSESCTP